MKHMSFTRRSILSLPALILAPRAARATTMSMSQKWVHVEQLSHDTRRQWKQSEDLCHLQLHVSKVTGQQVRVVTIQNIADWRDDLLQPKGDQVSAVFVRWHSFPRDMGFYPGPVAFKVDPFVFQLRALLSKVSPQADLITICNQNNQIEFVKCRWAEPEAATTAFYASKPHRGRA